MKANLVNLFLVTLFAVSIALPGCTPQMKPQNPVAQDIALNTQDIGKGWVMDAEVNDLDASYYFDLSEDGKAIIGTHRTVTTPAFDPESVESITMRGISLSEHKMVLYHYVVVFKNTEQALEGSRRFQRNQGADQELPQEWTTDYGERYTAREAFIGDDATMVVGWLDEGHPILNTLEFRKGRTFVGLSSMGQWTDPDNYPPIDEQRLEELSRIVEARIPQE
jgi:hypothetical protein